VITACKCKCCMKHEMKLKIWNPLIFGTPSLELKEESMKTKKIEIKRFVTFYKDKGEAGEVYRSGLIARQSVGGVAEIYPCTITFEIPTPERKVEVSDKLVTPSFIESLRHAGLIDQANEFEALFRDGSRG